MSAQIEATFALVLLAIVALAVVLWLLGRRRPLAPVTEWPPVPQRTGFAGELAAIGAVVETGQQPAPNYHSGEYPLVEVPAVEVAEPAQVAEPVEHVARHAAVERVLSDARPWLTPALHQEATPFYWATGELPTYDVDDLSATNSWNRAELLARIRQAEAEQAGVEAA